MGGGFSVQFAVLLQAHARVLKCAPERARMGVKELWIIDPEEKDVAVYRFDQDPTELVTTHSGEMEASSPLPPICLPAADSEPARRSGIELIGKTPAESLGPEHRENASKVFS